MMKLWLVGLVLALLCTVNGESECSVDHSKVHGKWYVNAMASNCQHFLKNKDMMKIVAAHVSMTSENRLKITTNLPMKEGCKKIEMEFEKLNDGTYFHTSEWGSTKNMKVVATDCKTFAMIRATMEYRGKTSDHLGIYTRQPELSSELKKKFLESCESSGFTSDQIIFPREVACEDED